MECTQRSLGFWLSVDLPQEGASTGDWRQGGGQVRVCLTMRSPYDDSIHGQKATAPLRVPCAPSLQVPVSSPYLVPWGREVGTVQLLLTLRSGMASPAFLYAPPLHFVINPLASKAPQIYLIWICLLFLVRPLPVQSYVTVEEPEVHRRGSSRIKTSS